MREAEALYLLAIALYLYETIAVVPLDAAVVLRRWRTWRRVKPHVLRSGAGPALVWGWPLPPLGLIAVGARRGRLVHGEARARVEAWSRATRWLRLNEVALFVAVFGGGAALVWTNLAAWPLLSAMAGFWVLTAVEAVLVVRALARRPRWTDVIVALASPLSALRLHDVLGKKVVADLDGLALAELLPDEARREAFREALVRARYWGERDPAEVVSFGRAAGLDVEALLVPPEREGPAAQAYCPSCHAQFVRADATCASCRDTAVVAFQGSDAR